MSVTPIEKSKSIQSTEVDRENIPDRYEYVEPKELAGRYNLSLHYFPISLNERYLLQIIGKTSKKSKIIIVVILAICLLCTTVSVLLVVLSSSGGNNKDVSTTNSTTSTITGMLIRAISIFFSQNVLMHRFLLLI